MRTFLWGMLAMAAWGNGLFLHRFWKLTRERLFLFLALGFWCLALHWATLGLIEPAEESRHYLFLLRLLGFVLILAGIADKNRRG